MIPLGPWSNQMLLVYWSNLDSFRFPAAHCASYAQKVADSKKIHSIDYLALCDEKFFKEKRDL